MLRAFLLAAALAAAGLPAGAIDLRLFTLGSGEVGGGYFAAANAICELLNRERRGVLRCSPEATPGSIYNLAALRDRQLDFALVQSDWQRYAYEGSRELRCRRADDRHAQRHVALPRGDHGAGAAEARGSPRSPTFPASASMSATRPPAAAPP